MKFLFFALPLALLAQGSIIPDVLPHKSNSRVVGGQNAPDGAVPYQVSLFLVGINKHNCGGSILNKRWVLTAEHCLSGLKPEDYVVLAGSNRLNSVVAKYTCKQYITYENNYADLPHDIALIEVNEDIVFNDKVQPINLPDEDTKGGATVLLSGWGRTDIGSVLQKGYVEMKGVLRDTNTNNYPKPTPNDLQWLNVTAITNEKCKEYHKPSYHIIHDTNLCTLNKLGEGACFGDSGGPLVEGNAVVGVVSWGSPCAIGDPDVFARVYKFKDWIIKNIKQ